MILNVRGTSGSGKTYTVKSFMEFCGQALPVKDTDGKVLAFMVHYNMVPVHFLGKYDNVCGGCDTLDTQDQVCNLVRFFSQFGHVIFEGLIISHSFMRYYSLMQEMQELGIPMTIARMDTELETCIKRVTQRRLDKGNTKPFNTKNTEETWFSTIKSCDMFKEKGVKVRVIKHEEDPVAQVRRILDRDTGIVPYHDFNIVSKF